MNNSLLFIKIFHTIDCIYKWGWRVSYLRCKLSTSKSPKLMPIVCPPISIPYEEFPPTQSSPVEGNQSEKSLIQGQAFSKDCIYGPSHHSPRLPKAALKMWSAYIIHSMLTILTLLVIQWYLITYFSPIYKNNINNCNL